MTTDTPGGQVLPSVECEHCRQPIHVALTGHDLHTMAVDAVPVKVEGEGLLRLVRSANGFIHATHAAAEDLMVVAARAGTEPRAWRAHVCTGPKQWRKHR